MNRRTTNLTGTVALAILIAGVPGCYSYVPTQPNQPEPGTDVRASLTSEGSALLVPQFGPGVTELGGMLLNHENDRVSMAVDWYRSTRIGDIVSGGNEAVQLSYGQIAGMERKQLSKGRTLLLGLAFVGGAILTQQLIVEGGRILDDEEDDDPPPPSLVVPLVRLFRAIR